MRRWARGVLIGVATGVLGAALALTPLGAEFEKNVGLSWLFEVRGPVEPPADVAVVAVDSTTGDALGLPKLPRDWPRTVHGQLVDALVERGAEVVVFDMDFSRPKAGDEDAAFARAVAGADRVVLFERLVGRREPIERADGSVAGWIWSEERLRPTEPLALAAKALAPFPLPKLGQSAFQFWAFKASAGEAPTTVATALQLFGLDAYDRWREALAEAGAPRLADALPARAAEIERAEEVRAVMGALRDAFRDDPALDDRIEALVGENGYGGQDGRLVAALAALYGGPESRYLNFYGPPGTIPTIPYHELVGEDGGGRAAADLAGKVVFVGFSDLYDPDQPDRFYTVFTGDDGIDLSGVEIMATAFGNLLGDEALRPLGAAPTAAILLAFGLAVGAVLYLLPAMAAVPLAFALAGLYGAGAQWAFNEAQLWLPLATPALVQLPFALLVGLMGQYLLGRHRERQYSRAMSYYLPESIVRELTEKGAAAESVNKVVYGTCLATDMSGFTSISETKSPKELAAFMNAYFDALAAALKRHDVDVTEFHADTIMCAWTAAEPTPEVRRKAVFAAVDLVAAIEAFGRSQGGLRLSPRIGLQDGHFYLGHTGGGGRMAYSILGDPANTAARLESLNKHLGTRVLAAGSVVEGVDGLLLRPLGAFCFVGKADATPVAQILACRADATPDQLRLCDRFAQALETLRARQWIVAAKLFEGILADYPNDGPSRFYLNRCQRSAVAEPPADDDPTEVRMDTK